MNHVFQLRYLVLAFALPFAGHVSALAEPSIASPNPHRVPLRPDSRTVTFTELTGASGVVAGGYGGLMISPRIVVGGGGFAFVNQVPWPPLVTGARRGSLGSGGFFGEFIPFPTWDLRPIVGTYVGGGNAIYQVPRDTLGVTSTSASSTLFIVAPRVALELDATRFLRVGLVGSYRFVGGSTLLDRPTRDELGGARMTLIGVSRF